MTKISFVKEVTLNVKSYASFVRNITASFRIVLILKIFENCILIAWENAFIFYFMYVI